LCNVLVQAVAEPVKEALTAEQVEEFTAIFNLYDKNRDGKLDLEVRTAFRAETCPSI
jgi:Ca2+-binding EF-hand superfamily protein